jgi:hypothetical protein
MGVVGVVGDHPRILVAGSFLSRKDLFSSSASLTITNQGCQVSLISSS